MMMPTGPLLQEFARIPQIEELRITVRHTGLAGTAVGVSAMLGGIFFGSKGLAVAGVVGSCVAAYAIEGRYKSVLQLYAELTNADKEKLAQALRKYLTAKRIADMQTFIRKALSNEKDFIAGLISVLTAFLSKRNMMIVQ